jgi:hypothetical protein
VRLAREREAGSERGQPLCDGREADVRVTQRLVLPHEPSDGAAHVPDGHGAAERFDLRLHHLDDGESEALLGGEVVEQGLLTHPGRGGDVLQGHVVVGPVEEAVPGDAEDPFAGPLAALRPGGHPVVAARHGRRMQLP